jgi:hypothetical protein
MQRPAPGFEPISTRPPMGMPKSVRPLSGRTVGQGASGCRGMHPSDRARPDRRAGCEVVAHALLAPERTDRRGGRSVRLGHARHVESVLRVGADRRDRPLARTTTRTQPWRPWSSRESRGSRGVGVHRSAREGPDWPVLPRPYGDVSLCSGGCSRGVCAVRLLPCWVSERSRVAELVLHRFATMLEAAPGAALRRHRENDLTLRSHQPDCKHIAYDIVYMLRCPGLCTLVRTHWARDFGRTS